MKPQIDKISAQFILDNCDKSDTEFAEVISKESERIKEN